MSKIDYKFKAEILSTDLPVYVNKINKAFYAHWKFIEDGTIIKSDFDYDTAYNLRCFLLENRRSEYLEAERIVNARYKRVSRLRKFIENLLRTSDTVVFVTLTFTDDILNNTSADTRRQAVRRFLSAFSSNYVANKDFGAKNGREHYHAVIDCELDLSLWSRYGFIFTEFVNAKNINKSIPKRYKDLPIDTAREFMRLDDEKRLSKYIAKLTNHAIKETASGSRIIYGRPTTRLKACSGSESFEVGGRVAE